MKRIIIVILCLHAVLLLGNRSASTIVHFNVPDIQHVVLEEANLSMNLAYSGNTQRLYDPVVLNSTYSIVSTGNFKQLVAQLNQNMPEHTTLEVKADAPANAISLGYVPLSVAPNPIITNISNVNQKNLLLYYRLNANIGAPVSVNENRVVTFTIMD
ncbi:MAG TPA: hypothetical protein PL063_06595 [Candidatus Cloacimonadota bacterium]|jgi:hypothetical protein|nr:hypothetical protein [Candidatus Cloacimonadales bacterium]HPY96864.1 hypothetical protein [Candidatus Cloacimonadota bacterium]HQB41449.1 hypothetical protein [Candidatus Cloacimonadota bacterium]